MKKETATPAAEGDAQAEQEKLLRLEIQSLDRNVGALRKENKGLRDALGKA